MFCDQFPWKDEFQTLGEQQRQLTPSGAQANFSEIIKGTPSIAERDKTSHVTFPAGFWHAASQIPSDRSSIHSIDTWLIAPTHYCQPFPPSKLPEVSFHLRHSWVSPYQTRNPANSPCSIHIQFYGLNFALSGFVQLAKQDSVWNWKEDTLLFTTSSPNQFSTFGGVWARE